MFTSIDDVLDFAIDKESEAFDYYTELAERMSESSTRELFRRMAGQEKEHIEKIKAIRKDEFLKKAFMQGDLSMFSGISTPASGKETNASHLSYQNALMLALEREESARKLYTGLAEIAQDAGLRKVFQSLAQEEATHYQDILAQYRRQTS